MQAPNPSPSEIVFDKDDQNLFQIDDLRLKADAIRYSILPKLNLLMNQAVLKIKDIFDIEVLDDSHIAQSPNFRTKRANELKVDYAWACVGLTGKRLENKWHGFTRKDGKPVQIVPFEYQLVLAQSGLGIYFVNHWVRLSNDSYSKLFRFILQYEEVIHSLCYATSILPTLYWYDGREPISAFANYYEWVIENSAFDQFNQFTSQDIGFPVTADDWSDLLNRFVWFYPVYDSCIQIALGKDVHFGQLVSRLNEWIKKEAESKDEPQAKTSSTKMPAVHDMLKAKESAEQRTKVMPALRWQVFQRDSWKCVACGRSAADNVILHVDHIVPRSRGGKNTIDNYQTLCNVCNVGKSNNDSTDLRQRNSRNA